LIFKRKTDHISFKILIFRLNKARLIAKMKEMHLLDFEDTPDFGQIEVSQQTEIDKDKSTEIFTQIKERDVVNLLPIVAEESTEDAPKKISKFKMRQMQKRS
jgi:hypothetical protein